MHLPLWKHGFVLLLLLVFAAGGAIHATDLDQNGINDALERALAERFRPSFILHDQRPVEPEPVEILTRGDCLRAKDLFVTVGAVAGGTGTFSICEMRDANGNLLPECTDPEFNYSSLTGALRPKTWMLPSGSSAIDMLVSYHWDYGGPGNESSFEWFEDYVGVSIFTGDPHTNPYVFPGSSFEPTVYSTIFSYGGEYHVQYYMWYPYNDWISNHEGDWESIVVTIDSLDPNTSEIVRLRYYQHHSYISMSSTLLDRALMMDTHPVVFVGGHGDNLLGQGEVSGGSWPAPGTYTVKAPWIPDSEETIDAGKFIPYQDVRVEMLPNIQLSHTGGAGLDHTYFDDNACQAWMRANLQWGHLESSSPGDWIPVVDVGNGSPRNPVYQGHWHTLNAGGFEPFDKSLESLFSQKEGIFVVLEAGDGGAVEGDVVLNGQTRSTPYYGNLLSGYQIIDITVPASVVRDGEVLAFAQWADGSTVRTRSFGTDETIHLSAVYGELPCPATPPPVMLISDTDFGAPHKITCPAGDGEVATIIVQFDPTYFNGPIAAESISIAPDPDLGLWQETFADGPADASNNYRTTISLSQVSGCFAQSLTVNLNECPIGDAYVRIKSPDATGDGSVNLLDLSELAGSNGNCFGQSGYDTCFDFTGDSCTDLADIGIFATHYSHTHTQPLP